MIKKKLYYFPGLISLIGLPIIFFLYPIEDPKESTVLKLNLPASKHIAEVRFTEDYVRKDIKKRKIKRILLSNHSASPDKRWNRLEEEAKWDLITTQFKNLSLTGDTSLVLQVEFDEESFYGDWVAVQNLALIYRIKRYAYLDNSFYFLGNPPEEPYFSSELEPLPVEAMEVVIVDPESKPISESELFWIEMSYRWRETAAAIKANYPITIGFVILILVPWVFWTRRRLITSQQ
jgi:hypothetical protein